MIQNTGKTKNSVFKKDDAAKFCEVIRGKKDNVLKTLKKYNTFMEAETLLKNLPVEIVKAKESIKESTLGYESLTGQFDRDSNYVATLEDTVKKKETVLNTLKDEFETVSSIVSCLEEKTSDFLSLSNEVNEVEESVNNLELKISEQAPENERLGKELILIKEAYETKSKFARNIGVEKEDLIEKVNIKTKEINELGGYELKQNELLTLTRDNNSKMAKIDEIIKVLTEMDSKNLEIVKDIESLEEDLANVTELVRQKQGKVETLGTILISKEEVDNLQIAVNKKEDDMSNNEKRIDYLKKEIDINLGQKGDIIKEAEEKREELKGLTEDFDAFKEKVTYFKEGSGRLENLKNKIPKINEEIMEKDEKRTNLEEELRHINNALDIINTELLSYKEVFDLINSLITV